MKNAEPNVTRGRRLVNGIASSALVRVVALVAPLLTIPLTYDVLGTASFGIWMTAQSLASMLLWSDLGLGNGLLTQLSASVAKRDTSQSRVLIASCYFALAKVAFVGCLVTLTVTLTPLSRFVGLQDKEASGIVAIALAAFFINIPLSLVQRIQYAVREVALSNVLGLATPVIAVIGAYICALTNSSPLLMITVIAFAPAVSSLISTFVTTRRHPHLVPSNSELRTKLPRSLITLGSAFVFIQILNSVLNNLDNPLITATLGPESTADYAIVAKLFTVFGLTVSLMNLPLWPANAEAIALGDDVWVRRTAIKMVVANIAIMLTATALALWLAQDVIRLWIGGSVEAPPILVLGFSIYWLVVAGLSPLLMVQNAAGILRWQAIGFVLFALVSITAKLVVVHSHRDMLPLVAAASYLLTMVPAGIFGYKRALSQVMRRETAPV